MQRSMAKAPVRIGFFGGGTDVSPYAEEHGGKVLNCTIDKYVRCMLRPSPEPGITIRSLDLEEVSRSVTGKGWDGRLELPQAVLNAHPELDGVEITMYSDVPPGSGLGSSSALVVSMLKLLDYHFQLRLDPYEMAELAYRIERVDIETGEVERLYDGNGPVKFRGPNDIVFDRSGGFWCWARCSVRRLPPP